MKIFKKKTVANKKSLIKGIIGPSESGKVQVIKAVMEDLSEENKRYIVRDMVKNFEVKLCGNVYNKFKKDSPKSNISYEIASKMCPILKGKPSTVVRKELGLSYEKANQLAQGEEIKRKENIRQFSNNRICEIEQFYARDYISRVDNSAKKITKCGQTRYLLFTVKIAYELFIKEYPESACSFSKFQKLMPDNIKITSKTPDISSLCVYCQNVKLKIDKMNIPEVKSEYDLYNKIICEKKDNERFRKEECIAKKCQDCQNWESKIRNLFPANVDLNKNITWNSWNRESYTNKNGKKSVKRTLVSKTGSLDECLRGTPGGIIAPVL